MRDYTSYSELSTLAGCEQRWYYRYVDELEDQPSAAMKLGTSMHEFADAFWRGEVFKPEFSWLEQRYIDHYFEQRTHVKVIKSELELEALLPDDTKLVGHIDGYYEIDGKLYLVERKTMKDWRRLDSLDVDLQISLYCWLARENDIPFDGVVYDAIRTYEWKRDAHPTSDSFQWLYLDRTAAQIDRAARWAMDVLDRRYALTADNSAELPIRNLAAHVCGLCPYKEQCWDEMAWGRQ